MLLVHRSIHLVLCCLAFGSASFAGETKIDPEATQRTWDGWGTSLAWLGKAFGERDDVADFLFSRKEVTLEGQVIPGLGLNIARYNAGACSESEVNGKRIALSSNAPPCRMMEGFWLDGKDPDPKSASWDWSGDKNQRSLLLKARQRGADRFELFSNSPMWWMCKNLNPSGAEEATEDNLRRSITGTSPCIWRPSRGMPGTSGALDSTRLSRSTSRSRAGGAPTEIRRGAAFRCGRSRWC
jgi:galactan endo-1,6-beta-galactosidase